MELFKACLKTCCIETISGSIIQDGSKVIIDNPEFGMVISPTGGEVGDDFFISDNWNKVHTFLEVRIQLLLSDTRETLKRLIEKQTKLDKLYREQINNKTQGTA